MNPPANRNLLFGAFALQMDFVTREQFIAAVSAWAQETTTPLSQIFVRQNVLGQDQQSLLESLVAKNLLRHGDDAEKCLAAIGPLDSSFDDLKRVVNAQRGTNATRGGRDPTIADPYATIAVGTPTSAGSRFKVLRPHAKGGLGEVFVAEDAELHREVALKQIQPHHADRSESRARFLLEAEITGGLEHPGIVPVYGLGCYADGRPYYAMRFIRGDTLMDAIKQFHSADSAQRGAAQRTLELRKLLGRFLDVCNAIEYAHSRGVLHRDLKPGNIMLGRYGETLVVDWGLAKTVGRAEPARIKTDERTLLPSTASASAPTQMGAAIGTPHYMSPEQSSGRLDQLTPASDVYSLGATLYCLLTGQPPFSDASDIGEVLRRVERGDVLKPSQASIQNPEDRHSKFSIPKPLEAICLKAMALKPADRYPSTKELAEDIEHWLADEPISALKDTLSQRIARWSRRHRTLAQSSALALILVAVIATVAAALINQLRSAANDARNEAVEAKNRAVELAAANLDLARKEATARANVQEQLARSLFERGWSESVQGHSSRAMAIVAQAHRIASKTDPLRLSMQNLLGSWSKSAPKLLVHDGSVTSVAFSPDATTLMTGSRDKTARLWDAYTGDPLSEPMRHDGWVTAVAYGPGGLTVLTGGMDKTVQRWLVRTGKRLKDPIQLDDVVSSVAYSAGRLAVVVGCWDKTARLWDVRAGKPIGEPLRHDDIVTTVAVSPDGGTVLTGSADKTARMWDSHTGKSLGEIMHHEAGVNAVAFSPDGEFVLTGGRDKTARLWHAGTGKPEGQPMRHESVVTAVAFSPDGETVLTGSDDHTSRLWDARTGVPFGRPMRHDDQVWAVAYSPDGESVLTGSVDKTARLWDVRGVRLPESPMRHEGPINAIAFSPDATTLVTGSEDGTARLWDARTGKPVGQRMKHDGPVLAVTFSADGATVLTGSEDKTARRWDSRTGKTLGQPLRHDSAVVAVAYSADCATALTTTRASSARFWNVQTAQLSSNPIKLDGQILAVSLSPDHATVVTRTGQITARICDARSGKPLGEPLRHDGQITAAAISSDGSMVLTGSMDRTARLWESRSGKPLTEPLRHEGPVITVSFSKDGSILLTGSIDRSARLWDARSGLQLVEPMQLEGPVRAVAYGPDGDGFVTGSNESARVWSAPHPIPEPLVAAVSAVRSGMKLRDDGQFVLLSESEFAAARKQLSAEGAAWVAEQNKLDRQRTLDWRNAEATEAEAQGHWFVAAFHLNWLLRDDSSNAGLLTRRSRAYEKLSVPQRAHLNRILAKATGGR
jgi:WD40 repeat protein/serine/threonine protein kinase